MNTVDDIVEMFKEIEQDLIMSMNDNMKKTMKDININDVNWKKWEQEALVGLNNYMKENKKLLNMKYSNINKDILNILEDNYKAGAFNFIKQLLVSILYGYKNKNILKTILERLKDIKGKTVIEKIMNMSDKDIEQMFFKVNNRKMNNIINETLGNIKNAENTILRHTQDIYRDTILRANLYNGSGITTTYQAVDKGLNDFLDKGITNIRYKNGNQVNIASYVEMELRTSGKKAYMYGEGEKKSEYGVYTVLISQYGSCSKICLPYQNHIAIDNVYSDGKSDGTHSLLSDFMKGGLYHPNCRHTQSIYFEDISTKPENLDKSKIEENSRLEQEQRYNERNIRKYKRLKEGSLDDKSKEKYNDKVKEWTKKNRELVNDNKDVLRRDYWREQNKIPVDKDLVKSTKKEIIDKTKIIENI